MSDAYTSPVCMISSFMLKKRDLFYVSIVIQTLIR